uniref:Family with sequence similarity 168 member A n=1 Tax=Salvator merianae TaxID=96440 RepID=A0A8D0DME4_SALMN
MNPVYSPVQPGAPYGNPKNMAYTGYPAGYPTAAPAYNPNMYPTTSPGYAPGYPAGTPYKVPPTQSSNAPPPYSPSPNPYQTAMYPIRSAYPQQNLYAQIWSRTLNATSQVLHRCWSSRPKAPSLLARTKSKVQGSLYAFCRVFIFLFPVLRNSHFPTAALHLRVLFFLSTNVEQSLRFPAPPCISASLCVSDGMHLI